jgi:hypothetical protein
VDLPLPWLALAAVALVALLVGLDRLFLAFEARGWMYWRRTKHRPSGGLGHAMLEIHAILEPGKKYVVEGRRRENVEDRESGDPPQRGTTS